MQYELFNTQQLQTNTTKNAPYHSSCMKSNGGHGTKLLLLLFLSEIARSSHTIFNCLLLTHHYCYPVIPRTFFCGFLVFVNLFGLFWFGFWVFWLAGQLFGFGVWFLVSVLGRGVLAGFCLFILGKELNSKGYNI